MEAEVRHSARIALTLFASLIAAQWPAAAQAQSSQLGCVFEAASAGRQVLRCHRSVTIVVEAGARFTLVDRDGDGLADSARLRRKALLIEAPAGQAGFVVITPQAIAAVRGTRWAVDVSGGKTSVFVERGRVGVRRASAEAGVVLGSGQGVDVDSGSGPLEVKRWGQPRIDALMARLGR